MIVGQLEIQMMASLARLQKDMGDARNIVDKSMKDIERSVERVKGIFATGFVATGLLVVAKQAMEAEQAINRLDAVVRATGNASGYTKEQLHGLADAMAEASQFDDEDIRGATASLLKFGNIHSETLTKALKLSADYAAFTKTDVSSAAETLGKALSSPAQGIERLQRSIGFLNPAQVEAIKNMQEMGDTAGAQSALMNILEQKIGGVADAMNTGYTKAFQDAKKATGEFFETVGNTSVVQGTVQSFLSFATQSMRDMKHIIEDGDWVQAAKFLMGFRQTDEQAGARSKKIDMTADPAVAAAAAIEAEKKFRQSLADQDAKFIEGAQKRQKAAAEEWLKNEEKMRDLDAAGWVALAEKLAGPGGVFDQENLEHAKLVGEYFATAEELRNMDYEGQLALSKQAVALVEAENAEKERIIAQSAERTARMQEYSLVNVLSEAGNALGGFLNALTGGFQKGVDYVKALLKQLLAQMISIFAQRWVLSLGASLTSGGASAALSSAAGQAGSGTIANGLMAAGSSYLFGSAATAATGAAAWAGPTIGTAATSGVFGSGGLTATLGAMGPVGWAALAVAAVAAVAYAFRDKGENWQGQLGFGSNANAYTTEGVFGREGFNFIQGQDATNRAIQDFMAGRAALDQQLAGHLTAEQIAQITANLGGAYTTRNDGQPSTFAFDRNDTTAAAQLTLEYVQKKYSAVFDVLDTKFAEFIRGYTGKAEDLLAAIGEFASLLDALDASGIKGLNIEALRAFQLQGEDIGATFTRISQSWTDFQNTFLTDAEKFALMQDLVTETFADLGIAVPTSMQAFKDLVLSLDLTTESGRAAFTALMAVDQGFAAIQSAMESATAAFNQTAGGLNPAYGSGIARANLESAVSAWRGAGGGNAGFTTDQTIAAIGPLINNASSLTAALAYAQSLGPQAVQQLNNMISAYGAWQQSLDTGASTVGGLAGSAANAGSAVDDFAGRLMDANRGLLDWINKTMLNPALSPLSPEQQFLEAQKQYQSVIASARGGDLVARGNLDEAAQTALEFARQQFGSSADYTAFYRTIIAEVGGVAGMTPADVNAKLFGALPTNGTLMTEQTGTAIVGGLQQLLSLIAGGINVSDPRVAAATEEVATNLKSATNTGALA